jgi:hypothetical protein
MAVCKKCKCEPKYCGCADQAIHAAPPCGQGTADCPNPEPCAETFSAECIVYTGDSMPELGITKGDRIDKVIQAIGMWILNPACQQPFDGNFDDQEPNDCVGVIDLKTTNITSSSITLSWDPSPTVVTYTVAWAEVPNPFTPLVWSSVTNITSTITTIANLDPDTEYYFKVNTICEVGPPVVGCESLVIKATTL